MRIRTALLIVGWLIATSASGEDVQTRDLLAFHVSDAEFQAIEVAPWVREATIQAFVSTEQIDTAAKWGVQVVHGAGPDIYYPLLRDDSNSGPPASRDAEVKAYVSRAKQHGLRVLLGINPAAPVQMVRQHPEWMICATSNIEAIHARAALDLESPEHFPDRLLGLSSPYGNYLIECLAEIMQRYDVDGFSFDGNYHPSIDFAPWAQEMFTRETRRPFPQRVDLDDLNYRVYLIWADDKLEDWYRRLHKRLREVKPDAAVYTWTTNAGRYGHFLTQPRVMSTRMNRLFDSPIQEWWLDEVNLGSSVVPAFGAAYVRAVTGDRTGASEPYLMSRGNPYCADNFPQHEHLTRALLAVANGSMVPMGGSAEEVFKELARRAPWCRNVARAPYAAMLVSEQTRQFYAYRDVMTRFLQHALGVFRAAYEEHVPLSLINDWDINPDELAKYKVLVLPNVACLSDAQVKTIRDWVEAGGGLVATCETSLFDELGRPRPDFALKDLFGVSYLGRPTAPTTRPAIDANFAIVTNDEYWAKRAGYAALRYTPGDANAKALLDDKRLDDPRGCTFKGPWVKITDPVPLTTQSIMMFPEAGAQTLPAGVIRTLGKGRVIYYPIGIDAANYAYAFRYARVLLRRSIEWAAGETFPIQVRAPMCVQATFFNQSDSKGQRTIIHLFNDLNTLDGHGDPAVDVPLREESVPIHDIKISFRRMKTRSVHVEPDGVVLKPETQAEIQTVTLPPLSIHAMVVVELE